MGPLHGASEASRTVQQNLAADALHGAERCPGEPCAAALAPTATRKVASSGPPRSLVLARPSCKGLSPPCPLQMIAAAFWDIFSCTLELQVSTTHTTGGRTPCLLPPLLLGLL